jgi:AmiR/NasT family two-component response regulator
LTNPRIEEHQLLKQELAKASRKLSERKTIEKATYYGRKGETHVEHFPS